MRSLAFILIFLASHANAVFAQEDQQNIAFFAGISSNAPVFGVQSEAYNLRFDSKYLWISPSIGLESFLKKTKKSTFVTQFKYQILPHGSMSITQAESTTGSVYTRDFDSLITKSDNLVFSLGVKHYFKEAFKGFYLQYNVGANIIFSKTSSCSCVRIESLEDNFFSESGTFSTEKSQLVMAELSFTFGHVFKLTDRFSLDAGLDVGMPFGKMEYPYLLEVFPLPSSRTKTMNMNALFLTSLIELHAKFLINL